MLQICCRYAAGMLQICCSYAAGMPQVCCRYASGMLQMCCMPGMLQICCRYAADPEKKLSVRTPSPPKKRKNFFLVIHPFLTVFWPPKSGIDAAEMLQVCCRYAADMLHARYAADMLLAGFCQKKKLAYWPHPPQKKKNVLFCFSHLPLLNRFLASKMPIYASKWPKFTAQVIGFLKNVSF